MKTAFCYQNILDEIVRKSTEIIGDRLTGIYLHGSMAMGCFHPQKSDIDLIIITREEMTDGEKLALMEVIADLNRQAPPKGLEISVVNKKYCNPFRYPTPFQLHFSPAHLQWFTENPKEYVQKMKGEDADLAAHFTVIRNYGIVLWGEDIETVFAPVPEENYLDSICQDIKNAKEDILEDPVYIILNLCRVLAYVKEGLCLSKKEGALWGIRHLPQEYHEVVREALEAYTAGSDMKLHGKTSVEFAKHLLRLIKE